MILVILALVANLVIGEAQTGLGGGIDPELTTLFQIGPASVDLKILLITASLFLVRDCALVMALNFSRNRRRADLAALVYLAVLYVIVPLVLQGFDLDRTVLMSFFVPQVEGGLAASAWPVLLQIAGLSIVVTYRWRTVRQPMAPVAACDPTYRYSCVFAENRDLATQLAEETLWQMLNGEYRYK